MTQALIAFAQGDGSLLAIRASDPMGTLGQTLATQYGGAALARDLVELGDLAVVGLMIENCIVDADGEDAVELAGAWDLECHRAGIASVHIFQNGLWRQETDAWAVSRT